MSIIKAVRVDGQLAGAQCTGFGYDAAAQAAIDESDDPKLRLHMALIRPDVAMGDLLKTQPGSQLFMVFSAPSVKPPQRLANRQFTVEVEGMDVYDPVSNALFPTSRDRIAAWFVDTDYDGRTFCICQECLPFTRPTHLSARAPWRVAVKVIDPRGNEGLRVLTMPE